MKIIFLDHDGVICLLGQWGSRYDKSDEFRKGNPKATFSEIPIFDRFDDFDPDSVEVLNDILEKTGAEIVISSDWRIHSTLEELQDYYKRQGIIKGPVAFTPHLKDIDKDLAGLCAWKGWLEKARAEEIRHFLLMHPEVEKWVAIDDLNMATSETRKDVEWGLTNFVLTSNPSLGLAEEGVAERVIEFLNS